MRSRVAELGCGPRYPSRNSSPAARVRRSRPRHAGTRTSLSDADLSDTLLDGTDLNDADLSDANLEGAYLINADLSHADLSGAQGFIKGSEYVRSLEGATMSDGTVHD